MSSASLPLLIDWQVAFTKNTAATLTCASAFNDLAALGESCGECGGQVIDNDGIVWYCGDVAAGSPAGVAEVWYSADGGVTFTGTATIPSWALRTAPASSCMAPLRPIGSS